MRQSAVFVCLFVNIAVGSRVILVENAPTCFRRVLAGKRAVRSHVRRVVDCELLEDCRRECATEKRFPCESFNYRLDPTFRGKGLCELMTKPIEAFDIRQDFVEDKDYDFYEVDRNSLEPYCPETLRGPGLLHSGYLSSKPERAPTQTQWRDRNWSANDYKSYNRFYNEKKSNSFNRRYEDQFYVPYQIGVSRSSEDRENWGKYGGSYGSVDSYYKDRDDYHKSTNHWRLQEHGVEYHKDFNYNNFRRDHEQEFNYNNLRRHGDQSIGYGYGAWKKGRWNNSGSFWKDDTITKFESDDGDENVKDCSSRRRPGMSLVSGAVRRSLKTRSVLDCEAACFGEREFKCVSYSYRYSSSSGSDNCYLSERPYKGLDMSADSGSDVYAMPLHRDCLTISTKSWVESECFWHVRSGAALSAPSLRASLTVAGLGACEVECIRAHGFFCRGFSFRFDPPTIGDDVENCLLTSSPPTTLELNEGLRPNKHELYARGNYGRGCEPALYDDGHHEPQCYLQHARSARLSSSSVRGRARCSDQRDCGRACTQAPFRCLSFSYTNNAPPDTDNCLLSEIRLFDLQRGVDYEHSDDDLLFAFDLFNGQCWRKVHGKNDYDIPTLEVPHPLQIDETYPLTASGPDSPPPSETYISVSGPSGPPAIKPYISDLDYKPGFISGPVKPYLESEEIPSGYKPFEPDYKPYYKPSRPDYVPNKPIIIDGNRPSGPNDSGFKPSYDPAYGPSRPTFGSYDSSGSTYGVSSGSTISQSSGSSFSQSSGAIYSSSNNLALGSSGGSSYGGYGTHGGSSDESSYGGSLYEGSSSGSAYGSSGGSAYSSASGSVYGSSGGSAYGSSGGSVYGSSGGSAYGSSGGSVYGSSGGSAYGSSGVSTYGQTNRPHHGYGGYRPDRPVGDRIDENLSQSWRHYTVSGLPCRLGTKCARNLVAGHWACEPEGGEIGSWDYCCAPTHRCGYSEGFRKPWCYVGASGEQWRPCSEKYYPYHQHSGPHPSQGFSDIPKNKPTYVDRNRLSGYLSEADRRYWDDLYKNGPQAYYDKYGNPLPGFTRVPTENRPYIKYERNPPRPGSGHWVPVALPDNELPPKGLGVPRYWPVAYLHKGPPPNMTYFKYEETERTTRSPQEQSTTTDKATARDIEGRSEDKPRSEKRINITNENSIDTTTIKATINETHDNITEKVYNVTEHKDFQLNSNIKDDYIKGIDGKLHDFTKSLEIFDIEDVKSDKLSNLRTFEAEEQQIEAIGRLLAARRGSKILIEKRAEKNLENRNIALDKDFIDFNFGNKFPIERRGVIQKVSKDDIEISKDKSLELSETTYVRPPRVLNITDNIRKAVINGKVFYDATIRDQSDLFSNSSRRSKNLRLEDRGPSVISSGNSRKKNIRTRNTNPIRRVKRVYRKRYNPEEVRRRLLERERSKNSKNES